MKNTIHGYLVIVWFWQKSFIDCLILWSVIFPIDYCAFISVGVTSLMAHLDK